MNTFRSITRRNGLALACWCWLLAARTPLASGADCNSNGADDAADIAGGKSKDCNLNQIPDECELPPLFFGFRPESHPVPRGSLVLRAGDLDRDGDLDLIAGSRGTAASSSISVLLNRGGGSFATAADYASGPGLTSLAIADLDGDGDLDAATAGAAALSLLANAGDGSFGALASLPVGAGTNSVTAADLDGDRLPELITTNVTADVVSVLANRGDRTFAEPVDLKVGDDPNSVAAGDLDGDGDLDLAATNRVAATVSVLLNQGGGSFAAAASYPAGGPNPSLATAGDFNGDGAPDLALMTGRGVAVLVNQGRGVFAEPSPVGGPGMALAAGDLDGDGDLDLAVGTALGSVSAKVNDGKGSFSGSLDFGVGWAPGSLTAADLDGDGDPDLSMIRGTPSLVAVLWNSEEGTFALASQAVRLTGCADARGCRPHSGALLDLNGDGSLDAIACNTHPGSFSQVMNDGKGKLAFTRNLTFGGEHPQSVAAGDLDGDGTADAVTVDNLDHRLYVHLGRGDGAFRPAVTYPVGNAPINVKLADLDGDGDLDAASANEGSGTVSALFNRGNGVFERRGGDFPVRGGPKAVDTADLDGDGDLDLAVANAASAQVSVLINGGEGKFLPRVDYLLRGNPNHVAAGDVDGDGRADLITANTSTRSASVLRNAGGGKFLEPQSFSTENPPYSVIAVDYNGDGRLDLITGSETAGSVSIFIGKGEGQFHGPLHQAAGSGMRFVFPGDLDLDGDLDLVTSNREGQSVTVIYNQAPPPAEDYLKTICTSAEFHKLSAASTAQGPVERVVKYLAPARDDPALLPVVFQNSRRFPLHQEFLAKVFPDRFPALAAEDYDRLVGRRATRQYLAGAVARIRGDQGPVYGFSVYVNLSEPGELLSLAETRDLLGKLRREFHLEPLGYFPDSRPAVEAAARWQDPGFPIYFPDQAAGSRYEAYTLGIGYGRVRVMDPARFDEANQSGRISFQDLLVLERTPREVEGVVAGVITAEPQGELSHLVVRTARRGTPNAYLAEAVKVFAPLEGKLVRLEVREGGATAAEASLEEAEAFWAAHRPRIDPPPAVDSDHAALDRLEEMDLSAGAVARFGGKATNFARLQRVLEGPFERYRAAGFAIPVRYYLEFLRSNRIPSPLDPGLEVTYEEHLRQLFSLSEFQSNSEERFRALLRLRDHMRDEGVVDPGLVRRLALRILEVFQSTRTMVRLRSSSNSEDLLEFNGAGLYDSASACAADDLDVGAEGPSRCDETELNERGVARALRRVWASLWNFRAYEEREYFGLPQESAAMGVLVSSAFLDERANGVAFTGNPGNPLDRRYVVIAQAGEASVVSPDPGVVSEKDVLEVAGGKVVKILRARGSSLLPPGSLVLSDAELEELGALMAHLHQRFPIDLGGHEREEVLLDLEFKVGSDGLLAVKQIRTFLNSGPPRPRPTFELEVPPGAAACGVFGGVERGLRSEYELKSALRLAPGRVALPTGSDTFPGDLIEELLLGPGRQAASPQSSGLFRVARFQGENGETTYRFSYEQAFALPQGERFQLNLSLLDYRAREGVPVEPVRALDEELLTSQLFLQGAFRRGEQDFVVFYSSCGYPLLPLWEVRAELADGSSLRLEERFLPSEGDRGTGPAGLTRAQVLLGGSPREVTDYWSLVYAAARHNTHVRYWVVLDPPAAVPGIDRPVHVVELTAPDPREGIEAQASYLGEGFEVLARPQVRSFRKQRFGGEPARPFRRGDVSADGAIGLEDAIVLLEYLFLAGAGPACQKTADANDSGGLSVADPIVILLHLFKGQEPLPGPFPACGTDPTPDDLSCGSYGQCE